MSLDESLQAEAMRVLNSDTCLCGGGKDIGRGFCWNCYRALPGLHRARVAAGLTGTNREHYAIAWAEASDWLKANTTRLRRPPA